MAKQEEMFETDEVVAAKDNEDSIFDSKSDLVSFVEDRFSRAEDARLSDEERWLRAYRNYRGIYGSEMSFTDFSYTQRTIALDSPIP